MGFVRLGFFEFRVLPSSKFGPLEHFKPEHGKGAHENYGQCSLGGSTALVATAVRRLLCACACLGAMAVGFRAMDSKATR